MIELSACNYSLTWVFWCSMRNEEINLSSRHSPEAAVKLNEWTFVEDSKSQGSLFAVWTWTLINVFADAKPVWKQKSRCKNVQFLFDFSTIF